MKKDIELSKKLRPKHNTIIFYKEFPDFDIAAYENAYNKFNGGFGEYDDSIVINISDKHDTTNITIRVHENGVFRYFDVPSGHFLSYDGFDDLVFELTFCKIYFERIHFSYKGSWLNSLVCGDDGRKRVVAYSIKKQFKVNFDNDNESNQC